MPPNFRVDEMLPYDINMENNPFIILQVNYIPMKKGDFP